MKFTSRELTRSRLRNSLAALHPLIIITIAPYRKRIDEYFLKIDSYFERVIKHQCHLNPSVTTKYHVASSPTKIQRSARRILSLHHKRKRERERASSPTFHLERNR